MADPTAAQKKMFARMGLAMPDGSYYIRNGAIGATDLGNAIHAVGRGEGNGKSGNDIRKHIMKRAAALKLSNKIPDTWQSDGSLKQSAVEAGQEFIAHFGVKGMKWGVRRPGTGAASTHVSADHARASGTSHVIKTQGLKAVSNEDLQHLVNRLNLESQHARLSASPGRIEAGHKFITSTLKYTKTGLDAIETGKRITKVVTP